MSEQQAPFLTTSHAARRIGVSSETIRLWAVSGKLPAVRTLSGVRLFSDADVHRLAVQRQAAVQERSR